MYSRCVVAAQAPFTLYVWRQLAPAIDWLAENARLPAREYWDDQWVQTLLRPLAVAGVEPYASRLKAAPDEIVQMFEPQEINIAVTGGEAQGAWKMFGARYEGTVSIDVWR